jgi:prepilin-type N-terminal cleavage/methylation domain-containing protein
MLRHARRRALSLTELLTVITVLGVLATIAIPQFNVLNASHEQLALDEAELANRAVLHYEQTIKPLAVAADDSNTTDELLVWYYLTEPPNPPVLGYSPYLTKDFPYQTTESTDDYRLSWTGRNFKLLLPGVTGAGIRVGGN